MDIAGGLAYRIVAAAPYRRGGGEDWLGIVGPCHRQLRDKRVGNFRCGRKLKIFPPS